MCCGLPLAGQTYCEFGERAELAIDADRAAMLLGHDVVTDRRAGAGAFAGWFGRKERLEQLVSDLARDAGPVVAPPYFDGLAEIASRHRQCRAEVRTGAVALSFGGCIEAVAE